MKESIFTKILREWDGLSPKEKLELIQKFEIMNAEFQKREAREIVVNPNLQKGVAAVYNLDTPTILTVKNLNVRGIEVMSDIHHEGFHALVDDYFKNKANIISLCPIDKNQLHYERSMKDIIYNRAFHEGLLTLFSLRYYEEFHIHKESCMYLLYNLLHSCQNINDTISILQDYQYPFIVFANYQAYTGKIESAFPYGLLLQIVENMDKHIFHDRILPIDTQKSITTHEDSAKLVKFFDENYRLFMQIQLETNPGVKQKYIETFLKNSTMFEK